MPAGQDAAGERDRDAGPDASPRRPFPMIRVARQLGYTQHR